MVDRLIKIAHFIPARETWSVLGLAEECLAGWFVITECLRGYCPIESIVSLIDSGVLFARAWEASYNLVLHFVPDRRLEREDFSDV